MTSADYDKKICNWFSFCISQFSESRIFLSLFRERSPNHWCMVQYDISPYLCQAECEETKGKEHVNEIHKEEHCNMQPYDPCDGKQKINNKKKRRREREESWEVMESMQWLAEVALRVEQGRMEAMREVERMRAQAEAKRGEMDLKRTEIIANTQLKIAKLLVGNDDNVDSALRIGRGS